MPRKADERLEGRIVDAAYQLWSRGGEHALTMRAVAKAAKTTTPTMYERFKDKHDLIEFLRARSRRRIFAALQPAKTALDICRLALAFALASGNEYVLFSADWGERLGRNVSTPSLNFLKQKLAQEIGGSPGKHTELAMALILQLHGAAMVLRGKGVKSEISTLLQRICLDSCQGLIEDAKGKFAA